MRFLCVHQGYELYGSDKTFLSCVDFLRTAYPGCDVEVMLPKDGPLAEEFRSRGVIVQVQDLWVLRKQYGLVGLFFRLVLLPFYVFRAAISSRKYDLVYVNTGVIIDYMVSAVFFRRKYVIHVHEIPTGLVLYLLRFLIGLPRCLVLFNSKATQSSLSLSSESPQAVVLNGVDVSASGVVGDDRSGINILMIGRVNSWKGQDLLVDAVSLLSDKIQDELSIKIVGDVFEGASFKTDLQAKIEASGLGYIFQLEGFSDDPTRFYEWADVVVVPSRKPEPFGLVAIEGMAFAKPVIAARHGGLVEIVEDNITGWLFEPNDASDLASKIEYVVKNKSIASEFGRRGFSRYISCFTEVQFRRSFIGEIAPLLVKR